MRIMQKQRPSMQQVSQTTSLVAPIGGLNATTAWANMSETEATLMENWFPDSSSVDLRNGYVEHVTGFSDPVETLAAYNYGTTKELYAVAGTSIYNATTAGAVGAAVVTGLTNARWQHTLMGTAGGSFLIMVNGVDDMRQYDGTTWKTINALSTPAITGVATSDIAHVNTFKNRLWLIEDNALSAWYLPVSQIAGAATELDLSSIFRLGGYLMAMANWTIDNMSGVDDYAAFITSEGEVALFRGTDPSSTATWALVGTFRMGRPIGRRCFCKAAADVFLVTADGGIPLSKAMLTDRTQSAQAATDKISRLVNSDIVAYGSTFGWQPIIHPIGKKLILNVPRVEGVESIQYVMNTDTGSWTMFTGWDAICFEVITDALYFGGATAVYQADTGQSDNGNNITARCQQAFSYFGARGNIKHWKLARPVFLTNGDITPAVVLNTEFQTGRPAYAPSFADSVGAVWDEATWDVDAWSSDDLLQRKWQTISGVGIAGGLYVETSTINASIKWQSTDFVYEYGGAL